MMLSWNSHLSRCNSLFQITMSNKVQLVLKWSRQKQTNHNRPSIYNRCCSTRLLSYFSWLKMRTQGSWLSSFWVVSKPNLTKRKTLSYRALSKPWNSLNSSRKRSHGTHTRGAGKDMEPTENKFGAKKNPKRQIKGNMDLLKKFRYNFHYWLKNCYQPGEEDEAAK